MCRCQFHLYVRIIHILFSTCRCIHPVVCPSVRPVAIYLNSTNTEPFVCVMWVCDVGVRLCVVGAGVYV